MMESYYSYLKQSSDTSSSDNINLDLLKIRTSISNAFLYSFAVLSIPALIASLYRMTDIGWQPLMFIHILIFLILWLLVYFIKTIPYHYKALTIVVVFLLLGTGGLLQFGLVSAGLLFLMTAPPLSILLLGVRSGAMTLLVVMICIFIIALMTVNGLLSPNVNLNEYHQTVSLWVTMFIGVFLICAALTTSISVFNRRLTEALNQAREKTSILQKYQLNLQNIIEEKTKELKLSNQKLERFVEVAAHDINSPLTHISGYAQLLKSTPKELRDDISSKYLDEIIDSSGYISDIIKDQLIAAKLIKDTSVFVEVDMNEILDKAEHQLTDEIKNNHANITSDRLLPITGVKVQLVRVFQNIIANAIKYRNPNKPLNIHISSDQTKDEWIFSVRDNGIGIGEENIEKIFDIYQRVGDIEKMEGDGIGLSSCKNIINNHRGRIWVESALGEGSTFFFTINKNMHI